MSKQEKIEAAGPHGIAAHSVDLHVGRRLRERRWLMGLTLEAVAAPLGIKAQQVQKYETGINRVSASRLWELSQVLEVPVSYFFDGLSAPARPHGANSGDCLTDREAASLVRAFGALPEAQRRRLLDLARSLGPVA